MTNPKAIQMQDYEPYVPEGLTLPKVGDRVKIRVSSECNLKCPHGGEWHSATDSVGHVDYIEKGTRRMGGCSRRQSTTCHPLIGACNSTEFREVDFPQTGHIYSVDFDCKFHYGWYAAAELTVVEEA